MANLKNITELPVAESAEGLNLIVNDGGSAKQIAASAVGAQADWSVTDNSNPAYVRNKPFYDSREFENFSITFDGDIDGKEVIWMGGDNQNGGCEVKISDMSPTLEELIGGTLTLYRDGESRILEISNSTFSRQNDNVVVLVDSNQPCGLINYNEIEGRPKGIWSLCAFINGTPIDYIAGISWNKVVDGELKQIEEKYVPRLPEEYDLDVTVTLRYIDSDMDRSWEVTPNCAINYNNLLEKIQNGVVPKSKIMLVVDDELYTDATGSFSDNNSNSIELPGANYWSYHKDDDYIELYFYTDSYGFLMEFYPGNDFDYFED